MSAPTRDLTDPLDAVPPEPWSQTKSGRAFPLIGAEPTDVHWPDVAYHLAHINRFAGAAGDYSVAEHSLLVADLLPPDLAPYGLLHDAHEAYIGDITYPVRRALCSLGDPASGGAVALAIEALTREVDYAVHAAARLPWPLPRQLAAQVHKADRVALMTERRDLLGEPPAPWHCEHVKPDPRPLRRRSRSEAEKVFLARVERVLTSDSLS